MKRLRAIKKIEREIFFAQVCMLNNARLIEKLIELFPQSRQKIEVGGDEK